MRRVLLPAIVLAFGGFQPAQAQSDVQEEAPEEWVEGPLFDSHELLEFSLHAPLSQLKRDRRDGVDERPAEVHLPGSAEPITLQVRTRGNYRLQRSTCPAMPPIRLNFPRSRVEGTVFEGQDKIKLVTHCRGRDSDEQNVLQEYLAYRVFNVLAERSFKVRLARITYVDSEKPDDDPETKYAFLIEDEEALAARLGGQVLEVPAVHPTNYARDPMLLVALFQFGIGNTDWSLVQLHNVVLFQDAEMQVHPIPYDFDWTGLVDAPYASPNETLRINSVRQRLYRGYCVQGLDYVGVAMGIREKRDQVLALPDEIEALDERPRRDALEYLEEFFDILEDRGRFERSVVEACRELE